ncbi:hypothetical protein LPJ73_004355, partial [Coemansia sp. RSA 2703]
HPMMSMYSPAMGDIEPTHTSTYYPSPLAYPQDTVAGGAIYNQLQQQQRAVSQGAFVQQVPGYTYTISPRSQQETPVTAAMAQQQQQQQQNFGYGPPLMRGYSSYQSLGGYPQQQQQPPQTDIAVPLGPDAMATQTSVMYQVGQPYQPGQVLGRSLDPYRSRLSMPPSTIAGNPPASPQYMVYRMPDGSTQAVDASQQQQQQLVSPQQQGQLQTIAEDDDNDEDDNANPDSEQNHTQDQEYDAEQDLDNDPEHDAEQEQEQEQEQEDEDDEENGDAASFKANVSNTPTTAALDPLTEVDEESDNASRRPSGSTSSQSRNPPGLRVEIPLKSRSRNQDAAASARRNASAARNNTAGTPDTASGPPKTGVRGRRFPLAVNTAARTAAGPNEPGPQTAMLIEYVQSLPSPSTFQPIVYQQSENFSPMEFGTTPIVGPQQTSAFQWPLPQSGNAANTVANRSSAAVPHQSSPLKRNITKDAASITVDSTEPKASKKRPRT